MATPQLEDEHHGPPKAAPRLVHYRDPIEGFRGFLAFGGADHRLAAGGCRVIPGLDASTITALADAMTLKQRLLGLSVDGAKAGIDYDPRAPGKREALRRFIRFLRPYLTERFSMGPDRGTGWAEIEGIGREEGLPSVKMAVARAQELSGPDFRRRLDVLDAVVGGSTLGQRRAGHALANAALAACDAAGLGRRPPLAAVQGFGNLGRGTVASLADAGVAVTVIADEHAAVTASDGLDVHALLGLPIGTPIATRAPPGTTVVSRDAVFSVPVDVVILAACEEALTAVQARSLPAGAVVVGANLGLSPAVEATLHRRGIMVIPDFVGGCGGSASMDALFGPPQCPSPAEMLDGTAATMQGLVHEVMALSSSRRVAPRAAALALATCRVAAGGDRPYGRRPHRPVSTLTRT